MKLNRTNIFIFYTTLKSRVLVTFVFDVLLLFIIIYFMSAIIFFIFSCLMSLIALNVAFFKLF